MKLFTKNLDSRTKANIAKTIIVSKRDKNAIYIYIYICIDDRKSNYEETNIVYCKSN